MTGDDHELLALLSVRIASIMEDEVGLAVLALPSVAAEISARFEILRMAGEDIAALSQAVAVVLRRSHFTQHACP